MATKVQGTKNRQAAQIRERETLESVNGLTMDSASSAVAAVQVEVQKALASVSAQLTAQLQVLQEVESCIQIRREELRQLHDIEATAATLDELEEQIKEQREAREVEQAKWKRDFAEQVSDARKDWSRQEADYQYTLAQKHRKADDARDLMLTQEDRARQDKQEKLEKDWAEREEELKKREQELAELRAFKEVTPETIRKAESAAAAVAGNSVKKEYETKMQLAAKDSEVERRLAEQQIKALEETIKKQQQLVDDLKAQLETAHRSAQEIAGKALDSASGRATTEALQRLMEKEQNSAKSSK
jgi:colicin import membrane protein